MLSLGPVAWFGRALSYPIYLWHVVFIALITPVVPGALGIVAVVAASIVTAYLSHRFVEGPALRLKDRLGTSAEEARSTSPAERELTNA